MKAGFEYTVTFTPDGREIYFQRNRDIYVSRWEDQGWSQPKKADFIQEFPGSEPYVSRNGAQLYYVRPGKNDRPEIWSLKKTGSGWAQPRFVIPGMFATTDQNGNIYVTDLSDPEDGGRIIVSEWDTVNFSDPQVLPGGINSPYGDVHPSVSRDGSFIVFDSTRPGGKGWSDFYVSFRQPGGTWSDAAHLDAISTEGNDICPTLSPDGKYLFFTINLDIYWVDAKIIDKHRD